MSSPPDIRSPRALRRQRGFTLIELLVVIIIIAVLAAIAIPTYLGQRAQAQDSAAIMQVRNALTTLQTAFADTADYTEVTVAMLSDLEPSTNWLESAADLVRTVPPAINNAVEAEARDHEVSFYAESATVVDLACRSESGNLFGIQVDTVDLTETGYVKVKVIDGSGSLGW